MPKRVAGRWSGLILGLVFTVLLRPAHAADMKPEDIVAKHLDSIGTAEARAAIKSRAVQGTLHFKVLSGGTGDIPGTWGRVSEQRKSNFVMRFKGGDWWGEQFVYDGGKTSFAAATATHKWSVLARFVSSQDFIVKEGLLGGELSTGWALQNLDPSRAKLDYIGLKKIDGRELQGIEYYSKGNTDMTVKLYFDPETYHHVVTIYSVAMSPNMSHRITDSVNQQGIRYTIEERFNDFQADNGITLPRHYDLQYTQELQDGSTNVNEWDMTVDKIMNNLELDPKNFQTK
ncbi:MAG: hypothetical protein WAN63_09220 [Candidatus Sulfotelmatobacter sp.]